MDWQTPIKAPRSPKHRAPPRKKANTTTIDAHRDDSSSASEPGEIKRKTAKGTTIDDNKPSTSAATLANLKKLSKLRNNSFALLSNDENSDDDDEYSSKEEDTAEAPITTPAPKPTPRIIKPPPIFIPDVNNIAALVKSISTVVKEGTEFTYKAGRDGKVRVMMPDKESYTALKTHLDLHNKRYQTFQPRDERAYRVVIKGLHSTTDKEDIKAELAKLGHNVRDCHNAINRTTKLPMGMFFVNLEPASSNTQVFEITRLCNAVVKIEPPIKFNDVLQCFRCQGFGHTQKYCRLEHRCVRCGGMHSKADCDKSSNEPACCVHCKGDHPASYKGCSVYKKAKTLTAPNTNVGKGYPIRHPTDSTPFVNAKSSYANILRGRAPEHDSSSPPQESEKDSPLEALAARMEAMMEKMLDKIFTQMTSMLATLIGKICK